MSVAAMLRVRGNVTVVVGRMCSGSCLILSASEERIDKTKGGVMQRKDLACSQFLFE